jgi:lipopolysaccharide export system protein LptC
LNGGSSVWLPVVVLLMLAGLTLWLNYVVQSKPVETAAKLRHDPEYIVDNFSARQLGVDGDVLYTLSARKMIHYPDDDTTHLEDVSFNAFEKNQPPLKILSNNALLTSKADEIFFSGIVVIVRAAFAGWEKTTMRTTYLHVIPDKGIGETDKDVEVVEANNVINATGMELNNKTRIAKFNRAKATYGAPR